MPTRLHRALPAALALLAAGLTLYAYRELPARPFAADDYQWLLNVRGLSLGEVLGRAFDPNAQSHFYRPLVWLLFWAQTRLFGLEPAGYHAVSLAMHLAAAALLGWLVLRVARERADDRRPTTGDQLRPSSLALQLSSVLAFALVALHPAPFEAVVWISAQSELLAALLLLLALHLWLPARPGGAARDAAEPLSAALLRAVAASAALGLALLAKESAAIGLGLLFLAGLPRPAGGSRWSRRLLTAACLLPPALLTLGYLALQAELLARNIVVQGAGYGLGPQLLLNPLRTLGLVAAPLPGTQYGDAPWLPLAGAAVALAIIVAALFDLRRSTRPRAWRAALAVALTLLPTAPFTSPPDSRYVYLPLLACALLLAAGLAAWSQTPRMNVVSILERPRGWSRPLALASLVVALALAWWAAGELGAREGRFAAASGPGGSLWRLATAECGVARPSRIVVVEPPLAPPHAEAIVRLACGPEVRPLVVGRDGIEDALRPGALVVAFPGGGAQVERRA
jgi:hypothetical protein